MNRLQRLNECCDCFKLPACKNTIDYTTGQGKCKGFLDSKVAISLLREVKNRPLRSYLLEINDNFVIKPYHKLCSRTKKQGLIGIAFKKGVKHYEPTCLALCLGSWSQRGSGGYFVLDLERNKYVKAPSFYTLEEEKICVEDSTEWEYLDVKQKQI